METLKKMRQELDKNAIEILIENLTTIMNDINEYSRLDDIVPIYSDECYFCHLCSDVCSMCEYGEIYGDCNRPNSTWEKLNNLLECDLEFIDDNSDIDHIKIKNIYSKYIEKIKNSKTVNELMNYKKKFIISVVRSLNFKPDGLNKFIEEVNESYWNPKLNKKFNDKNVYVKDLKDESVRKLLANGFKKDDVIFKIKSKK